MPNATRPIVAPIAAPALVAESADHVHDPAGVGVTSHRERTYFFAPSDAASTALAGDQHDARSNNSSNSSSSAGGPARRRSSHDGVEHHHRRDPLDDSRARRGSSVTLSGGVLLQHHHHQNATPIPSPSGGLSTANTHNNTTDAGATSSSGRIEAAGNAAAQAKLSWKAVAFFTFVVTSAGPFGIESAIRSGGPLVTIALILAVPLLIMAPIIFIMEELASWMPTNHGNIRWVERAFGPEVGFANAVFQTIVNLIDVSVYPVLVSNYLFHEFYPNAGAMLTYLLRAGLVCVLSIQCYFSVGSVALTSAIITLLICAPFWVGVAAGFSDALAQPKLLTESVDNFQFANLFSIAFWLYNGFIANGALSGEVQPKALLKGQLVALTVGCLMYLVPVCVVLHVNPKWSEWSDGYLVTAFDKLYPNLGFFVSLGGIASGIGLFISSMTCYSRAMWGVADMGWLPSVFTRLNRHGAPHYGVTLHLLVACLLVLFDFDFLIQLEFVFAAVTYLLYALAFVALRVKEPYARRRYVVPGGLMVACVIIVPLGILVGVSFTTSMMDPSVFFPFILLCGVTVALYRGLIHGGSRSATGGVGEHGAPSVAAGGFAAVDRNGDDSNGEEDTTELTDVKGRRVHGAAAASQHVSNPPGRIAGTSLVIAMPRDV